MQIKRNILLNPGPATTTDTVKLAQVVPDICPREKDFAELMSQIRKDLVRIVHGEDEQYTSVLFCGSGTICIDVCLNSLLPKDKKILIINNGSYSQRAVEICRYYGLPYYELKYAADELPDLEDIKRTFQTHGDIALVYTTHNETGTGLLNPIRAIGEIVHRYGAVFTVDTTSTYAMRPIDVVEDHIDFCMASAQKGIMAMTGVSFIVGKREMIERSKEYPQRSYYCNLFLQYDFFERTGEMHFTPPVQTIYAMGQALKEYFIEGEKEKWARHTRVYEAIRTGLERLGFRTYIPRGMDSGLVVAVLYPKDDNWDFKKIHDYCYERGFTIYPGKLENKGMFRLCALGAIDVPDIKDFFEVFQAALSDNEISIPVKY